VTSIPAAEISDSVSPAGGEMVPEALVPEPVSVKLPEAVIPGGFSVTVPATEIPEGLFMAVPVAEIVPQFAAGAGMVTYTC